MKKFWKVIPATFLMIAMLLAMISCSSYGKLEKAFEKEDYKVSETAEKWTSTLQEELGKGDEKLAATIHVLSKDLSIVLILEFNATDDIKEFYENSETAKEFVKDIKSNEDAGAFYDALVDAGYAKGNCFVIPVNPLYTKSVTEIVKGA